MSISLVAGLGNPGIQYEKTRHNVGFLVLDAITSQLRLRWQTQRSFEAMVTRWDLEPGRTILFAKPLTFMNASGQALQAITGFYNIPATSVIAVHDDLTINLGLVKVTVTGSAGGHNGVASLIERFGGGFIRYRIGIGPKDPPQIALKDFVIGQFTSEQQHLIDKNLDQYTSGLRLLIEHGADRAMNQLNRRDSQ